MGIDLTLKTLKSKFDNAIKTAKFDSKKYDNGNKAKEALIRSQKVINLIHEFIKGELISCGVNKNKIYPSRSNKNKELSLQGFLKAKNQDISIVPEQSMIEKVNGFFPEIEKILTVNVRSQLSSLAKNIDTLYERTFAESLNLHLSYPKQCLGEVYLIPTHEYDDKAMVKNKIVFKSVTKIEKYIKMFQAINNRDSIEGNEYKYERVCLLIADFRVKSPKIYSSKQELINDGLIPKDTDISFEKLSIEGFVEDLLAIYSQRFEINNLY